MKPLIMEEGLFDEIEKSIMGQRGVVIRAILEQDDAKYQKSLWKPAAGINQPSLC